MGPVRPWVTDNPSPSYFAQASGWGRGQKTVGARNDTPQRENMTRSGSDDEQPTARTGACSRSRAADSTGPAGPVVELQPRTPAEPDSPPTPLTTRPPPATGNGQLRRPSAATAVSHPSAGPTNRPLQDQLDLHPVAFRSKFEPCQGRAGRRREHLRHPRVCPLVLGGATQPPPAPLASPPIGPVRVPPTLEARYWRTYVCANGRHLVTHHTGTLVYGSRPRPALSSSPELSASRALTPCGTWRTPLASRLSRRSSGRVHAPEARRVTGGGWGILWRTLRGVGCLPFTPSAGNCTRTPVHPTSVNRSSPPLAVACTPPPLPPTPFLQSRKDIAPRWSPGGWTGSRNEVGARVSTLPKARSVRGPGPRTPCDACPPAVGSEQTPRRR